MNLSAASTVSYANLRLAEVIQSQSDRLASFIQHKQFFISDAAAEGFLSDVISLGDWSRPDTCRTTLRESYAKHNKTREKYSAEEVQYTRRLGAYYVAMVEQAGKRPKSLLDVGCGSGLITSEIARQFEISAHRAVGLDIALPQSTYEDIELRQMYPDAVKDVTGGETFDLAMLSMVLHHSADIEKLFSGTVDAIKPGGALLLREHDSNGSVDQFLDVIHVLHEQIFPINVANLPNHSNYRSLNFWQQLASQHGLRQVALEYEPYENNQTNSTNVFTALFEKIVS